MVVPCVTNRQLPGAPFAAEKAGKQCVAVLRRSMMAARGYTVADHLADLLRQFPTDIAFVRIREQGKPFITRLAANSRSATVSWHRTTLTISTSAAVDRVLDHPVNGRIVWFTPEDIPIGTPDRQVQPMFEEP